MKNRITEDRIKEADLELRRQMALASEISFKNKIPYVTALIMAGDIVSAERATRLLAEGTKPECALATVGSYARFGWAVENRQSFDESFWVQNICELWSGSDPDDTNPEFLELFRLARTENVVILKDEPEKTFPGVGSEFIWLYRGQRAEDPIGISWTTKRSIAKKFASGAAFRTKIDGVVYATQVRRVNCIAYITGRGEHEVIVDVEAEGIVSRLGQPLLRDIGRRYDGCLELVEPFTQ